MIWAGKQKKQHSEEAIKSHSRTSSTGMAPVPSRRNKNQLWAGKTGLLGAYPGREA
jgi:hypothetical protein